ncbi:MFS general substrate transporter [Ramicandelaber brevisporus]|nr:MFS general substrate transporter [Ramicandelaber brevisporus]
MSASISKDEAREKENEQVTAVAIEDVDKDAPEHPVIPRLHYWTVVTALSLYSFVAMLDATIIISTLPTILPTFHVPVASSISWLVSGCVLTTAIFLPIVSKLCDIVGSKRTFLTTVLLYIVGTTLGGTRKQQS